MFPFLGITLGPEISRARQCNMNFRENKAAMNSRLHLIQMLNILFRVKGLVVYRDGNDFKRANREIHVAF